SAVAHLLSAVVASQAASFRTDHEAHRDALSARIQALGGTPEAAKPTYDITPAPTDQASALRALAAIEDTAGKTGYRMVAGTGDTPLRTFLMTIMAAEGQHSSILLAEDGQPPIGPPFQSG
ncbi:MAG TPA: ferritin-like domain-containing protein, partial [Candidatus Dormibacteraeota bacterium]